MDKKTDDSLSGRVLSIIDLFLLLTVITFAIMHTRSVQVMSGLILLYSCVLNGHFGKIIANFHVSCIDLINKDYCLRISDAISKEGASDLVKLNAL